MCLEEGLLLRGKRKEEEEEAMGETGECPCLLTSASWPVLKPSASPKASAWAAAPLLMPSPSAPLPPPRRASATALVLLTATTATQAVARTMREAAASTLLTASADDDPPRAVLADTISGYAMGSPRTCSMNPLGLPCSSTCSILGDDDFNDD